MLSEELFKNVIYFILTETCMEKLAEVRDQLKVSQCPEQLDDPKGWTIPSTVILCCVLIPLIVLCFESLV